MLDLQTDEPTRVSIIVSDGSSSWEISSDGFSTDHHLTLLGFRPGKTHTVAVTLIDEAGNIAEWPRPLQATTAPLPPEFPPISVTSDPEKMEPGVTLFPITGFAQHAGFGGAIVAVNPTGEIVWYHRGGSFTDVRRIANGNLLFIEGERTIIEMDMLGNVLNRWASLSDQSIVEKIPVPTQVFHHEVFQMESGNFLTLSIELRSIDNFPTSATDPNAPTETSDVVGDVVVEFTPQGSIVNEWKLLDLLDPLRINYSSLIGFWNAQFPEAVNGTRDWSHGNAVIHDPRDDSIIVSARHQDAVFKFSRETGQLIWILGPHENWDPGQFGGLLLEPLNEDQFFWQYHQHAPELLPNGNLLLFDNGNFRASPFDPPPGNGVFSRAVEYEIDEASRRVAKVWEYGEFADEVLFAGFVGEADFLTGKGNVLITFGAVSTGGGITPRLIEVTHSFFPEKVFDLSVNQTGWFVYRSERLPSLYP
jgi:Arylsulfotransferase (ASST).